MAPERDLRSSGRLEPGKSERARREEGRRLCIRCHALHIELELRARVMPHYQQWCYPSIDIAMHCKKVLGFRISMREIKARGPNPGFQDGTAFLYSTVPRAVCSL